MSHDYASSRRTYAREDQDSGGESRLAASSPPLVNGRQ